MSRTTIPAKAVDTDDQTAAEVPFTPTGTIAATDVQAAIEELAADVVALGPPLIDFKNSVRVATTANITLSGEQTIDGVAVVSSDRVLVKDQSTGSQNGIYVCAAGAWSRSTDADGSPEVTAGMVVLSTEGTANADKFWQLTTNDPITLGTTALTFAVFSGLVTSVFGRTGAVVATAGDYTAAQITFTPAGTIAATQVQAAIAELDSELPERIDDRVAALLVAGANITLTYNDPANTITISSAAGYTDDDVIAVLTDVLEDGYRLRWDVETDSLGTHFYPDVVMEDQAETYAADITIDLTRSRGDRHTVTLTGNPTLTVTNFALGTDPERPGKLFRLVPTQDATGGRTIDFTGSSQTWIFPDGEPALTAIPGGKDELEFLVTSVDPPEFTFVRAIHRPRRIDLTAGSSAGAWTIRTSAANNDWQGVVYGAGLFVAVSANGVDSQAMTSADGITWTLRNTFVNEGWSSIAYGNGLFVAVSSGRVMTSPDGITWTARTAAAANSWTSVTYGNGLFVAVSNSGTSNRVMTSPNGITWTSRTSAADNEWNSVTYGNGLFVAVSTNGTGNRVMTSPDGITWTSRTSAADNQWRAVTYGNGLFVAVSGTGTGNRVMTSPDGITWTSRTSAADNSWFGVTYGNGLFVAVAITGSGNRVMTSPDGVTWTAGSSAANNDWYAVTYGDGLFVAVSASGSGNRVMTSPTANAGLDWLHELNYVTLESGAGTFTVTLGDVQPSQVIRVAVDNTAGGSGTLTLLGVDFGDEGSPTLPASGKCDLFELTAIDATTISGRTIQTGLTP